MRMTPQTGDWISLVKAGYCLESDDQTWIDRILYCARRLVDAGTVSDAWPYTFTARNFSLGVGSSTSALSGFRRGVHEILTKEAIDALYRTHWVVAMANGRSAQSLRKWIFEFGSGVFNILGINCWSGTGTGLIVALALASDLPLSAKKHERWSEVTVHLAAGLRLHKMACRFSPDIKSVEGVLDPSGTLRHGRAAATTTARANLREAVRQANAIEPDSGTKIQPLLLRIGEAS